MAGLENVCDFKGCGKKFKKAKRLVEHKRSHTGEMAAKIHRCNVGFNAVGCSEGCTPCLCTKCDKTFVREIHLKRHMLSHNGTKPFSCGKCKLMFTTKHYLKRHVERAHNRPFKCSFGGCEKQFKRHSLLKIHGYTHTNETPFRCKERGCYRSFNTPAKLESHKKLHNLGFHNFFPRVRNDLFAHRWLQRHLKLHKCPIFCQC